MSQLALSFLGTFQVILAGRPITHFRSVNVQGLLVYLAMRAERPINRDLLATLFWSDESDRIARNNFRQSLYQLRKLLAAEEDEERPFLIVTRDSVQFNPDCDYNLDVAAFLTAVKQGDLAAAGASYTGELLPGFTCPSLEFEDWLRLERERLHRRALDILGKLADELIAAGDFREAGAVAHKQLALESWRESAHRQLMLALAYMGDRTAALAQYARCQEVLDEELGIEPEPETADLAAQIEANELLPVGEGPSILEAVLSPPFQAPIPPPHFVDRQDIITDLAEWLMGKRPEGSETAAALVGMGGLGKSSLAAAIAQRVRTHFADGVLWADVRHSNAHNILASWAAAYGYDYSGLTDLASRETAVRGLLADKKMLIVLDDVDTAAAALPLLLAGTQGAVLLTSRNLEAMAALNADLVPLTELSPSGSRSLLELVLGGERVSASGAETAAADEIGQLLAHLPLAVEIVAQLLKSRRRMPLAAMAARLHERRQRLGLAVSDLAVRTSFQVSWEELDDNLKQVFAGMALFNGRPFAPSALAAVTDQDQFDVEDALYTLSAFSLVRETGQTRYQQHPLLADFAAEKLNDWDVARRRYADYYLDFTHANSDQPDRLSREWENLAAAVTVASDLEDWQMVLDLADALSQSWLNYGRYDDALQAYELAETAANALESEESLARILLNRAKIEIERSDYDSAWDRLKTAERIYYQLEDGPGLAQVHLNRSYILFDQGEYGPAEKALVTARGINVQLADLAGQAKSNSYLASVYFETDADLSRAEETARQAYRLQKEVGRTAEMVKVLRLLADIEIRKGDLEAGAKYAEEAAELSQELGIPAELGASNFILSTIYMLQGNYDDAEALCEKTLTLFQRLGNKRYEGLSLQTLGGSFLRSGKLQQAKSTITNALSLYEQVADRLGYGYALRQLGDVYDALGQTEERNRAWQEAKQLAEFLDHAHLRAQLVERMGT